MREIDYAILPGFVFVGAEHLDDLARIALDDALLHPPFSVFQMAGRVPLIGSASLDGLREEEADAAVAIQAQRDAETRAQAQRARAEQMRTDRARRTALRRERRDFEQGARVAVLDMPSMAGMIGSVESSSGTKATIHFGGSLTMEIEAWQVIPAPLLDGHA
ncbi:hypothetical protein [Sphingopyxis sp. QXT-31]|uniref:hypothetical protein n=1 Tax=Sphingopyxis sp. QXT-31 TaxID=1357916 RepID=UPI0012EBBB70|nr:hypothetical protein [Sphingopyxis sp. QXT-31]